MSKRIAYRNFVILFIILSTFSVIDGYIKLPVSLLMITAIVISFLYVPYSFANKQTLTLFLYFVILFVHMIDGSQFINIPWIAQEFLIPFTCLCIVNVFLFTKDYSSLKTVTFAGLIIVMILSVPTIILLQFDPDLLRYTASSEDNTSQYAALGLMRYGVIQALPFLLPIVVYFIKTTGSKKHRLLLLVFLIMQFIVLVLASFATSIILGIVAILLSFIATGKSSNKSILIIGAVTLVLLLNKPLLVDLLSAIQPYFENTAIFDKITDINNSLLYGEVEGEVAGRGDLYDVSWNIFLDHPLLGNSETLMGGHSFFIDRLAYFGIIGSLPFFAFLYFSFKNHYSLIPKERQFYYIIGLCAFLFLGLFKNVSGIEPFLYILLFLPGACFLNAYKTKHKPETIFK